jgi:hypothetical protein
MNRSPMTEKAASSMAEQYEMDSNYIAEMTK